MQNQSTANSDGHARPQFRSAIISGKYQPISDFEFDGTSCDRTLDDWDIIPLRSLQVARTLPLRVKDHMTEYPLTVQSTVSIEEAAILMSETGVRHLPVLEGDHLVGLVSERDLIRALGLRCSRIIEVEDIMVDSPYVVEPDQSLLDTLEIMTSHRIGCVIVKNHGGYVVGVFTATDAIKFLIKLLKQ